MIWRDLYRLWREIRGEEWESPAMQLLRDELDALRSQQQVPLAWRQEFEAWRRDTPVPADPLVTVCIATFDRAELLLGRALPSVVRQTYPHLDIVIVGEACTDDTAERVTRLGDPRIRFVNLAERPRYPEDPARRWMVAGSVAMNHALSLARGHYVTHLDDDDRYALDRIALLVAFARQHDLDFVWHPFRFQDARDRWRLNPARRLGFRQVTTSSVFYRSWFTRVLWDPQAYLWHEPGDWNRFRRIKFLEPRTGRHPEALLWHHRERQGVRG